MCNKAEIIEKVGTMVGSWYQYRDKEVVLNDFKPRGSIITFEFTTKAQKPLIIEKDIDQVEFLLAILKPLSAPLTEKEEETEKPAGQNNIPAIPEKVHFEPQIYRDNRNLFLALRDGLVDDLQKVRSDKTYIPQAKQACNTSNAIINLAKLELAMLKAE